MATLTSGSLITEAPVHFIQASEDDEREFLGVCLWAHFKCLLNGNILRHTSCSIKSNPEDFWRSKFSYTEIDIGITLSTAEFRDVALWRDDIGRPVVYLTMCIDPRIHGWKSASKLVMAALHTGERGGFRRWIAAHLWGLLGKSAFDEWKDFLANELNMELHELVAKVDRMLSSRPCQRTILVPTIGGSVADYCIDHEN